MDYFTMSNNTFLIKNNETLRLPVGGDWVTTEDITNNHVLFSRLIVNTSERDQKILGHWLKESGKDYNHRIGRWLVIAIQSTAEMVVRGEQEEQELFDMLDFLQFLHKIDGELYSQYKVDLVSWLKHWEETGCFTYFTSQFGEYPPSPLYEWIW